MTSSDVPRRGRTAAQSLTLQLSPRDREVIEFVAAFRQVGAQHIGISFFLGLASSTPMKRCLRRLVEGRYLARLERPVGGNGGGSGSFVYVLGRAGWKLLGVPGHFWLPRSIDLHTIMIADCHSELVEAQHRGELEFLMVKTEPHCHESVGTVLLTPDLFTEIGFRAQGVKVSVWWEIDRSMERQAKIEDKLSRYWRGFSWWQGDVFPYVIFVVPPHDEKRKREIERIIEGGPQEAQALFKVWTLNSLPQVVHRLGDG